MSYKPDSQTLKDHKARILDAALLQAAEVGYQRITRDKVAEAAGVSLGIVNQAFGTMDQLKRDVMRHAVKRDVSIVIAQGLGARDPHALKATDEQKQKALATLL